MDYTGTSANDIIDQAKLSLANGTIIYGGAGDDTISFGFAKAIGEAGNDTLIGTTNGSEAVYWPSPAGVNVNLATGIGLDGYGTTDKLINIHNLHGSNHNDTLTGGPGNDTFFGLGGNNIIRGGGGIDTAAYYNVPYADVAVTYSVTGDSFTVLRRNQPGGTATDRLVDIDRITFEGNNFARITLTPDDFTPGYFKTATRIAVTSPVRESAIEQLVGGDFNGDGKKDFLILRIDHASIGLTASPLQILLGDGKGGFVEGTSTVFNGVIPTVNYVPRIWVADFNKDGVDDLFAADFGYDAPPFPGGQNSLYMSSNGKLVNVSSTLPQRLAQNHGAAIGDINNDGKLDLLINALNAVSSNNQPTRANDLMVNNGTSLVLNNSLLPPSINSPGYEQGSTWSMLADLNNDGYADMVLGDFERDDPSMVYLNDGKGSFAAAAEIPLPLTGIYRPHTVGINTIDLNHDNLPDMVISMTNGGDHNTFYKTPYLQLLINEGNGRFRDETALRLPQDIHGVGGWYKFVDVVDLNGDGAQDMLVQAVPWSQANGTSTKLFLNDGSGRFSLMREFGADYASVHAMDVNGDGVSEILYGNRGEYLLYANDLPRVTRTINGTASNDSLTGAAGNDLIVGGAGVDTVHYSGARNSYNVVQQKDVFFVKDGSDTDTILSSEILRFSDISVNLGVAALSKSIAPGALQAIEELYIAYFNRLPDAEGLSYWIKAYKGGSSIDQIGESFYAIASTPQFAALTGYSTSMTNAAFVTLIYKNVLGRTEPDAEGLTYWSGTLAAGTATRGTLVSSILSSAHTFKGHATLGYVADLLDNKIVVANYLAVQEGITFNGDASTYLKYVAISQAVTPASTDAAISLIGVTDGGFVLS